MELDQLEAVLDESQSTQHPPFQTSRSTRKLPIATDTKLHTMCRQDQLVASELEEAVLINPAVLL